MIRPDSIPNQAAGSTLPLVAAIALVTFVVAGCSSFPEIPITTPEPIQVNITMRVDVHQISGEDRSQMVEIQKRERDDIIDRQLNRSGEIQELKNNRLIGENHRGLLTILQKPAGTWGDYTVETVDAENADRMSLMRWEADESGRKLDAIQKQRAALNIDQSFPGEWVELMDESTGGFRWIQVRQRQQGIEVPDAAEE